MRLFEDGAARPRVRPDGLLSERVDDELVVYDEATRMAHCLSSDAARVWYRCDGTRSESEIARELSLPPATVEQALGELQEAGLLEGFDAPRGYTRRQAGKRFAAVGGATIGAGALLSSIQVPAALAACSRHACTNGPIAYTDWNQVNVGDYAWFNSNGHLSWTPDTTTVITVTGTIMIAAGGAGSNVYSLAPIKTIITFSSSGNTVSLNYTTDGSGNIIANEVVPLSCAGGELLISGLMWLAPENILPSPKTWSWTLNVSVAGTPPPAGAGIVWQFGAGAFDLNEVPPFAVNTPLTAADYNNFAIAPASGGCSSVGAAILVPSALASPHNYNVSGGSGGGGSNFTGSRSSTNTCSLACA